MKRLLRAVSLLLSFAAFQGAMISHAQSGGAHSPLQELLDELNQPQNRNELSQEDVRRVVEKLQELKPGMTLSPALSKTAGAYLNLHLSKGLEQIESEQLYHLCYMQGCLLPPVSALMFPIDRIDLGELKTNLERLNPNQLGLAGSSAGGGKLWILILLSDESVRIGPFKRSLPYPQEQEIRGELIEGMSNPRIWVTGPGGKPQLIETKVSGRRFSGSIDPGEGKGIYQVEIMAEGALGPKIAALFPMYVGTSAALPEPKPTAVPNFKDLAEAEAYLFRELNSDRKRFGLPALTWNAELHEVARAHSREMADSKYFAHVSPVTQENAAQRLRRRGVDFIMAGENIAAASSDLSKIQPGLMGSPGHRSAILNPEFTEAAVGVAVKKEGGSDQYFATQLFILPSQPIDINQMSREIFSHLESLARERRAPPFARDAGLTEVARLEALSLSQLDPEDLESAGDERMKERIRAKSIPIGQFAYQRFRIKGGQKIDLSGSFQFSGMSHVGIGLMQGTSRYGGANTVWGVLIFAELKG